MAPKWCRSKNKDIYGGMDDIIIDNKEHMKYVFMWWIWRQKRRAYKLNKRRRTKKPTKKRNYIEIMQFY